MTGLQVATPEWFDSELELLGETCRRFYLDECAPQYERWESQGQVDRDIWLRAGDIGLLCPSVPEAFGGPGGNFAHDAVIAHAATRFGIDGLGLGFALHSSIAAPYLLQYASEDQKRRWLPKLAHGQMIAAIAMTEPVAGSDLQGIRTAAARRGNQYVINGQKTFITNGQLAELIVVVAKTDPAGGAKGTSLFVVETENSDGFRRGGNLDKIGFKSNDTAELFFDGVEVPAENLLGMEEGQGFYMLMEQLPQERLVIALGAMGRIERALEVTIDYVRNRQAFGAALIDFQNTQFVLAECKAEATIAKVFVNYCIGEHLKKTLDTATASMAKYWLTDLQCRIIDRCLQLHGGYGYMNEYPIARMYRDARVERIYGGTNEIMKMLIARTL